MLCGAGQARFGERPVPEIEDPHDVIVRIAYTGVCGSDVHFWVHGGVNGHVFSERPLVMGHEASGIVHAVGSSVTSLRPGDHVALEPGYPCRRCARCKAGRYNLCPKMKFAGCPPDNHGTLTKYFKLPEDYCFKIDPKVIGLDEAVLLEPLAVGVHAARQVGVKPGDEVVVFGAGTVGILCAAVAREFGARRIISVDVNQNKLSVAKPFVGESICETFIPDPALSAEENAHALLSRHGLGLPANGGGVDVVIDATGAEPCVQTGIHILRTGGAYIQTGMGRRDVNFPIGLVADKELVIKGCFRYGPGDYKFGLELVQAGKIVLKSLITKVFPFEQATEAWETTRRGEGIKTLIQGVQD